MEEVGAEKCLSRRRSVTVKPFRAKDERVATLKKVASILQKSETDRTHEEKDILLSCGDVVKEVNLRQEKRDRVKARLEEVEDAPEILEEKCMRLAAALSRATSLAVYTGAGISTAASIPDYRGTNGVWTRLQQGKDIGNHDLSQAEPTITHMALYALYKARVLKHIVSQNCDGLHLRSGIPRTLLSEVHGDMYIEVCRTCKPNREYWRLFDVTEKTARYSHGTGRTCHKCNSVLQDSIVHFGERGNLSWPINWNGASRAAKQADIILCLGSSLKVLKKYPWLWQMDRPVNKRPALYIVNLQWTPKDENAVLKINGRCDEVMKRVMTHLGLEIAQYNRAKDPIFHHAIRLQAIEQSTTSQPCLEEPATLVESDSKNCIDVNQKSVKEEDGDDETMPKTEEDCNSQITTSEPMTAYPAPYFTALPFLSMGLPFPPMYMYPHLTPFFYYPFIQVPPLMIESPKPKPACSFCMENEGSLTCLFYPRDGDDPVSTDLSATDNTESEIDSNPEPIQENESLVLDPTTPIIQSAKNPGWFGKGYRKGMRKKR
ncbi:NAD-dependent protein deacetylase sirtuin-7 [Neodiprion lecontei]|uniref:protein acetyllysine N-acetyltransferase n=1 Tax=Neodiprion lecontei TaxID=441921 RepID=A0A6J0B8U6_NEOLC|nr:NAD-dependent protein deacetylase sirtuin-7 [Neodiprion lecontei]XP_046413084.1 NAD-dependent protein deacetylase sirtuin-7 [Neodiprion fabricii]